jgi:hypothetical protein
MKDRPRLGQWVRATWAGWVLGVPLIILLALAAEAAGIGGAQVMVGAAVGLGVGFMQYCLLRRLLDDSRHWIWSSAVGLALPFLVTDISNVAGTNLPYSLHACVALGGLIAGVWQALILRRRFRNAALWVPGSGLGWTLAAAVAGVADSLSHSAPLRGLAGALAYLAIVAAGGVVLGIVTGVSLPWLRPRDEPD